VQNRNLKVSKENHHNDDAINVESCNVKHKNLQPFLEFQPKLNRWKIERKHSNMYGFYLGMFVVLLGVCSCIFLLLKAVLIHRDSINVLVIGFQFGLAVFGFMVLGLTFLLYHFGEELFETYFNTLIDFEEELCGHRFTNSSILKLLKKGKLTILYIY